MAASSIRLTAAGVEMSGFGVAFRITTTTVTDASGVSLAGITVPGGDDVLVRRLNDRHVERRATYDLLVRRSAGADRDFQHIAGLAFEVRGHAIEWAPHTARRDEADVRRPGGLGSAQRHHDDR